MHLILSERRGNVNFLIIVVVDKKNINQRLYETTEGDNTLFIREEIEAASREATL